MANSGNRCCTPQTGCPTQAKASLCWWPSAGAHSTTSAPLAGRPPRASHCRACVKVCGHAASGRLHSDGCLWCWKARAACLCLDSRGAAYLSLSSSAGVTMHTDRLAPSEDGSCGEDGSWWWVNERPWAGMSGERCLVSKWLPRPVLPGTQEPCLLGSSLAGQVDAGQAPAKDVPVTTADRSPACNGMDHG